MEKYELTKETQETFEEKQIFLDCVEDMLICDQGNNMVDCLAYLLSIQGPDIYDEYLDIIYTDGHTRRLLITGNSNSANLKAITAEVYR